ncbi:MAG: ABC transporter substrate-binding protein [SAR324 cluster bacterium]|nr:ABC transporter substrate-binding protein [SAR324 cluster bacterium]
MKQVSTSILQGRLFDCLVIATMMLWMTALSGCEKKAPIKIGFVGNLTGRLSLLGTGGRDGTTLAVENINKTGGILGRKVELIVKDDRNDPEVVWQVDQELIDKKVVAIIGHMLSDMSLQALPLINQEQMVMISPTSTSNSLTGLDDYFFRIALPDKRQTDQLAQYAYHQIPLKKIAGIYDQSNQSFTEGWYHNFQSAYKKNGGMVTSTVTFTSGEKASYFSFAQQLLNSKPDGVVIVASALDTALLCQQIRKLGSRIPILSSGWAKAPDLLQHGGSAVEGLTLPQTHNEENPTESYLLFTKQFEKRFGKLPNFAAAGAYDAAQLLFETLSKNSDPNQLKQSLLTQHMFQGLQGEINIDQYGDAERQTFLIQVNHGQFKTIE